MERTLLVGFSAHKISECTVFVLSAFPVSASIAWYTAVCRWSLLVMRWGLRKAKLTASRWASAAGVQSDEPEGGRREASMICWRRSDKVDGERDEKRAM